MSIGGTYQHKRNAAATWASTNPVLMAGEIGLETDTLKLKAGDGTTAWTSLSYLSGGALGALLASNNLSDLGSAATARTNLGLGSAATQASTAFDAAGAATTAVSTHVGLSNPHTQYLQSATAATTYAPLASPTLTGVPLAPTATVGTNTTQIATTAFVTTAVAGVTVPVTSVAGRTGAITLTAADIASGTLADARLSSNVALYNTAGAFTATQTISKVLIPPQVTGLTNPLTIRANTGGTFTEPAFYVGQQGSETTSGIAVRSNGSVQLLGGAAIGQFNDVQIGPAGTAPYGFARGAAQSFNLGGSGNFTFDAGTTATSFDAIYSAKSSTTAGRNVARTLYSFATGTDATRIGQVEEFISSYGGNARTSRRFGDGTNGYTAFTVSVTAPTDASLQNSELAFYTDGSGQLKVKLKDSSGTVRTGTVTLT